MKLLLTALLLASPAHAISNADLDQACHERGAAKVAEQAAAYGCTLTGPVRASEFDNRWWNSSKYIWYVAPANEGCTYPEISKLVQYYKGQCL